MADWKMRVLGILAKVPPLQPWLNRIAINLAVNTTKARPRPWSLWSPDAATLLTDEPYVSWQGLVDRRYTGRHLPPAGAADQARLPPAEAVADLFMRERFTPSGRTSTLFCFFAQWFTDSFLRTASGDRRLNTSNHEIDLCQIYGLDAPTAAALRTGRGGMLRSRSLPTGVFPARLFEADGAVAEGFAGLPYVQGEAGKRVADAILPGAFGTSLPAEELERRKRALHATGLERGSNTILYAAFNAIFLREHNRICAELAAAHPGWDDHRLFETARNVNTVLLLKLIIEEYINQLAGLPIRFRADPSFAEKQRWYRTNRIAIEFNLLYRWHSMIPDRLELGELAIEAADYRFNNTLLESLGAERLIAAASRQPAGRIGLGNVPRFMWQAEKSAIEFARSFRLQPFNAYRECFGLKPYASFGELTGDRDTAARLEALYGPSVDRLEFGVGLFAEHHEGDASFGELLRTMVACDAFSQALTNPLLSMNVFGPATFSETGARIIADTSRLEQIVARNAPAGAGQVLADFHL